MLPATSVICIVGTAPVTMKKKISLNLLEFKTLAMLLLLLSAPFLSAVSPAVSESGPQMGHHRGAHQCTFRRSPSGVFERQEENSLSPCALALGPRQLTERLVLAHIPRSTPPWASGTSSAGLVAYGLSTSANN